MTALNRSARRVRGPAAVFAASILMIAGCGGDAVDNDNDNDDASGPDSNASDDVSDDGPAPSGDASAELTIDGETYVFTAFTGCVGSGAVTSYVGAGDAPDGQSAELSASFHDDPPGSDGLAGGSWKLTGTVPGDTPGLPSGEALLDGGPGLIRSDDDGHTVESDGTTLRMAGPTMGPLSDSAPEAELVVTCGEE